MKYVLSLSAITASVYVLFSVWTLSMLSETQVRAVQPPIGILAYSNINNKFAQATIVWNPVANVNAYLLQWGTNAGKYSFGKVVKTNECVVQLPYGPGYYFQAVSMNVQWPSLILGSGQSQRLYFKPTTTGPINQSVTKF